MERAGKSAQEAGLSGVLVTPGPDLLYLTGYAPLAVTERLTMLVLAADREPALIVPVLERPDAESAPGSSKLELSSGRTAATRTRPRRRSSTPGAATRSRMPPGRMHVLGLQGRLPDSGYVSMTEALPMLRAIKDADELARLTAAGEAADAAFYDILEVRFAGRTETDIGADLADALEAHGHSQVEFTVVGVGAERREPASRAGRAGDRGGRHGRAGLRRPRGRLQLGHDAHRSRGRADGRGADRARDRRAGSAGGVRRRPAGRGVPGGRPRRARGDRRRAVTATTSSTGPGTGSD